MLMAVVRLENFRLNDRKVAELFKWMTVRL